MLMCMELNPAKMELLTVFFDAYLPLTKEEERQVWREVEEMCGKEEKKVMEWKTHFERYAMEEGIEQGIEQGKLEVARQMLQERLDPALIAKLTGFSLEQIDNLRNQPQ